ncbi:MAG: phage Gp37/Gp68 family protein [Zoogloeaceae bacterium]|nr:phage Gp37/Gp68 family protein [Zoogloeaceae bacterium]
MTAIEWTHMPGYRGETWNPVRGCSIVSKGCTNCYAMKQAHRFSGPGGAYEGLTMLTNGGPVWTGAVRTVPDMLDKPLRARVPTCYFVNSMSDLFHEDVPDEFIDQVFAVMALSPQHRFLILTKRPERMLAYTNGAGVAARVEDAAKLLREKPSSAFRVYPVGPRGEFGDRWFCHPWPPENVYLGVSVEDQATADERIPLLLQTPAAVRFVSYEPALGAVDFGPWVFDAATDMAMRGDPLAAALMRQSVEDGSGWMAPTLDWIIVGGESGPKARPFDVAWARSTIEQCRAAGVPVFVKQ